jgi:hypothetical protein
VIEIIRDSYNAETRQARHDWAGVTGQMRELKPSVIHDMRTGAKYSSIAGAIGWPTALEQGCMIIAGVSDSRIQVLEFKEHRSVYDLIEDAIMTRKAYRHGDFGGILPDWCADPDRYEALVAETSVALEKKLGPDRGFYIREPADWYDRYPFPLYMWQLRNALSNGTFAKPEQSDLVSRLQAIHPDIIDKGKVYDYPAAGILSGLVHTIITERTWEQDIDHGKPIMMEI